MKILSIRGGGIKGKAPAVILTELEFALKKPCHEIFDLIVGTSTGGILALGLGLGVPAATLEDFYNVDGPTIFKRRVLHYFGLLKSRYDGDVLEKVLAHSFDNAYLRNCLTKVMVTLSDVSTRRARFAKSWKDGSVSAAQAGRATAAAPDYFDPVKISAIGNFEGGTFCDGGLFANNPALFALVEAVNLVQTQAVDCVGLSPAGKVGATLKGVRLLDLACPEPETCATTVGTGALRFLPQAVSDVLQIGMDASATACRSLLGDGYLGVVPKPLGASDDMADVSTSNLDALGAAGERAWSDNKAKILELLS